jgi:hypothetical protein
MVGLPAWRIAHRAMPVGGVRLPTLQASATP